MSDQPLRIGIVVPVFNDWPAFCRLTRELDEMFSDRAEEVTVIAVDDGSYQNTSNLSQDIRQLNWLDYVSIVKLVTNVGHQRAIVVGLYEANRRNAFDAVIVMDSDGEDKPADVLRLIDTASDNPEYIILAYRAKRSESFTFRVCYAVYKLIFRIVTGEWINFGNFCFIPISRVEEFLYLPHSWNNVAAAISVSRLPRKGILVNRGPRLHGESKMNFVSLVLHGFSAMSVYTDKIMARIILMSVLLCGVLVLAAVSVVIIRITTDLAIPGWATTAFGLSLVLIMQNIALGIGALFFLLNLRSTPPRVPIHEVCKYIKGVTWLETR